MSNKIALTELQQALACVPVKSTEQSEAQHREELQNFWFTLGCFAELMRQWDVADHVLSVVRDVSTSASEAAQMQAFDAGCELIA